jgi:hypothetical protein
VECLWEIDFGVKMSGIGLRGEAYAWISNCPWYPNGIHGHGQSVDPKTISIEIEHNKQKAVAWERQIFRCFSFVCHTDGDGLTED